MAEVVETTRAAGQILKLGYEKLCLPPTRETPPSTAIRGVAFLVGTYDVRPHHDTARRRQEVSSVPFRKKVRAPLALANGGSLRREM